MRAVIIVLVAALATMGQADIAPSVSMNQNPLMSTRIMEQAALNFIGCVQDILKKGLPEHNLPSFDPLYVPSIHLDLDSLEIPELAGVLDLANIHLARAVNWEITDLKIGVTIFPIGAKIDIILTWADVFGHTDYSGEIGVGDYEIFGTGSGNIQAKNFSITVHTKVATNPFKIRELSIRPHIGTFRTSITGLFGDEELSAQLSEAINAVAADWLNDNAEIIDKFLSDAIMGVINNTVQGKLGGEKNIITIILDMCRR